MGKAWKTQYIKVIEANSYQINQVQVEKIVNKIIRIQL